MHNSKFHPNNDMVIHWGRFGWRMLPIWLLSEGLCWHRHKQDASHQWGSKRSSILKTKSPVERNIVRWNRRLDWIALLLQTNLSSTVLNTNIENAHLFLSQYAGNLHTNYLGSQIILIQLYSCHSVACPTSHFAEGQTQRQLWLYTFKNSFFLM